MFMQKNFVTALLFLALLSYANAAIYYVDINGVGEDGIIGTVDDVISSDSNPGTAELPWKTIARAQNYKTGYIPVGYDPMVQPGDTVLIRNGSYGAFNERTDGVDVNQWHLHRTDWVTYKTASGHTPIFDGIRIDNGDHYSSPLYQPGESYLKFEGFRVLDRVMVHYTGYVQVIDCNITGTVESYEGLYAPYFPFGSTGMSVRYGSHHITIQDNEISQVYRGMGFEANDVTATGNIIHYFGEDGFGAAGQNIVINRNHVYDSKSRRTTIGIYGTVTGTFTKGDPVTQAGSNATGIYYGENAGHRQVYQTGINDFSGSGTLTGPNGTIPVVSKVDYSHCDAIQIDTSNIHNISITNNILHDIPYQGIKLNDATGSGSNATVANNLIYNVSSFATINGLADVNVYNNTFVKPHTGSAGTLIIGDPAKPATTIVDNMYNNIISDLSKGSYGRITNHGNNIFGDNPNGSGGPTYPFSVNSTELVNYNVSSLFIDAANGDFRLAEDSIAINFGDPANSSAKDILGNPRDSQPDAGAYEFQSGTQSVCGNNIKETGETCDGTDLAGQTCQSQGFAGGTLACTANCLSFNTSNCTTTECIDNNKLLDYLSQWKQGNITLLALMQKMGAWKAGTGC